ncbi:N-acetylmuramoyl-L-alanine amidase [Oxalobacteraceae bacterium CAVE-383]|nr:N-acetylmuramoyl-L-alanine amidase [Oxalobacteraceae bacterium CAVE-383]
MRGYRLICLISALSLFLSACSTTSLQDRGGYLVDSSHSAVSVDSRIKHLILHYTVGSFDRALYQLSRGPVSAHYLVPQEETESRPVVLQLVPEQLRAWHAGASYWQGRTNINDSSIGIEIVNQGPTETPQGTVWQAYTPFQIAIIKRLASDVIARYGIEPIDVLGHSDIAPSRKSDPGPLFPWKELAAAGIGAWPDAATVDRYLAGRDPHQQVDNIGLLQAQLRQYGYDAPLSGVLDPQTVQVLSAFQMHFRPSDYGGAADAETGAIAAALLEKYHSLLQSGDHVGD